jgi:hypothetical protein
MSLIWVSRPNVIYLVFTFEEHCGLMVSIDTCHFYARVSFIALLPKFVFLDRSLLKNDLELVGCVL